MVNCLHTAPIQANTYTFVLSLSKFLNNSWVLWWRFFFAWATSIMRQFHWNSTFISFQHQFGCTLFLQSVVIVETIYYYMLYSHRTRIESQVKCSTNQCVCCSANCTCHECMSMHFVFYAWSMQLYNFVLMRLCSKLNKKKSICASFDNASPGAGVILVANISMFWFIQKNYIPQIEPPQGGCVKTYLLRAFDLVFVCGRIANGEDISFI